MPAAPPPATTTRAVFRVVLSFWEMGGECTAHHYCQVMVKNTTSDSIFPASPGMDTHPDSGSAGPG
jgi:hypothetical protein